MAQYDDLAVWAACLLGFFGFLRAGEFTAPPKGRFDPTVHLTPADIAVDSHTEPTKVCVTIKRSKTDQFRDGASIYLSKTGARLCPIVAILNYLVRRGAEPGPLFRLQDGAWLTRERLVCRMREALSRVGIEARHYAGHSFRIGAATTAAANGIQDAVIKSLGRWKSSAYQGYVQLSQEDLAPISKILIQ